jgi:hypothetical protein
MRQMSEVSCSLSEQELHFELPDVLELLGSRPSRVLLVLDGAVVSSYSAWSISR